MGLGNPGSKYNHTRHNIGFEVIDQFVKKLGLAATSKFKGELYQTDMEGQRVYFLKPQTYMNLSGESAGDLARFYQIPSERVLVIVDDLDLPEGQLRLRLLGGAGGHNGLKSMIEHLGTENFPRLRLGIGRSDKIPAESYVLMKLNAEEQRRQAETVKFAVEAVEGIIKTGCEKAMNSVNQKREPKEGQP